MVCGSPGLSGRRCLSIIRVAYTWNPTVSRGSTSTTPYNSPKIASPDFGSSGWFLLHCKLGQSWLCCWNCFKLAPRTSLSSSTFFLLCFTFANIVSQTPLRIELPNQVFRSLMSLSPCSWTNLNEATTYWRAFSTTINLSPKEPILYPRLISKITWTTIASICSSIYGIPRNFVA